VDKVETVSLVHFSRGRAGMGVHMTDTGAMGLGMMGTGGDGSVCVPVQTSNL